MWPLFAHIPSTQNKNSNLVDRQQVNGGEMLPLVKLDPTEHSHSFARSGWRSRRHTQSAVVMSCTVTPHWWARDTAIGFTLWAGLASAVDEGWVDALEANRVLRKCSGLDCLLACSTVLPPRPYSAVTLPSCQASPGQPTKAILCVLTDSWLSETSQSCQSIAQSILDCPDSPDLWYESWQQVLACKLRW